MTTRILAIDRDHPEPDVLDLGAQVLLQGGLVAFATETVYGLGADATNPEAVARIFAAKGRPAINPLIVHASGTAMARSCVIDWPEAAEALAEAFWPGPLTLVLARSDRIPDIVTAGHDTVGVRVPEPAVARHLIAQSGRPLAAPSANRSNRISPTLARHVAEDLEGRIDLILDSGQTTVGLESTVLDLSTRQPRILRPGPITPAAIGRVLGGRPVRMPGLSEPVEKPTSPGQLAVHYAPRTPAVRVAGPQALADFPWPGSAALIIVGRHPVPPHPAGLHRFDLETPEVAARDLYRVLHECDALGVELIVVVPPPDHPDWSAIRDRLWRATVPSANPSA